MEIIIFATPSFNFKKAAKISQTANYFKKYKKSDTKVYHCKFTKKTVQ
jgi:Holliday junction resolvase-like predicted endonuclease